MYKDEISDNNNQCENVESITEEKVRDDYVECVSEDGLCDVGGGMTLSSSEVQERLKHVNFKGDPKIVPTNLKYRPPWMEIIANRKLKDLADNKSTKEK